MASFFEGDPSARRAFDTLALDTMPDSEAIEVLEKGFKEAEIISDHDLLEQNIAAAGGYPHSIQLLGHNLINVDVDKSINKDDWDKAFMATTKELQSKEFSSMYSFGKPLKIKDEILDLLAKENKPLSQKEIKKKLSDKNIYQYIPVLKKSGAIKQNDDDKIYLQSQLFRTAILMDKIVRSWKEEEN